MDLSPYVDRLRQDLVATAEVGGDEARALADRLTAPLEASLRLALLSALSTAAEELTGQLAPGSVDVRLRGDDIGFVVTAPPPPDDDSAPGPGAGSVPEPSSGSGPDVDDGGTARITLRLPEQLKARAEDAAGREGLSVNSWLVRAVANALDPASRAAPPENRRGSRWSSGQHYTGWAR